MSRKKVKRLNESYSSACRLKLNSLSLFRVAEKPTKRGPHRPFKLPLRVLHGEVLDPLALYRCIKGPRTLPSPRLQHLCRAKKWNAGTRGDGTWEHHVKKRGWLVAWWVDWWVRWGCRPMLSGCSAFRVHAPPAITSGWFHSCSCFAVRDCILRCCAMRANYSTTRRSSKQSPGTASCGAARCAPLGCPRARRTSPRSWSSGPARGAAPDEPRVKRPGIGQGAGDWGGSAIDGRLGDRLRGRGLVVESGRG